MAAIRLRTRIMELKDPDNCLVLLVRDRNHAVLSIVTIDKEDTINMEAYDFLPNGNLTGASCSDISTMSQLLSVIFENQSSNGQVRSRKSEHVGRENMDIIQLWKLFKFHDSGLDAEYLFWECSSEDYKNLKASIDMDIVSPPRFSLAGADRFFSANGHNCYTWAKEKLSVIDQIDLEITLWDRFVAAEPQNHIQPQNNRGCSIF